eukprot:TRINITY_DN4293_c0_g1_i1.p1 TRINITY_DN4293_c0_g1~~TRINITY_DN4293_c0_g1_i1.p1  ORF type:complete len:600 (+),score=192.67 TRINITY_DN4293_c0_g1_i1:169-1968(+)
MSYTPSSTYSSAGRRSPLGRSSSPSRGSPLIGGTYPSRASPAIPTSPRRFDQSPRLSSGDDMERYSSLLSGVSEQHRAQLATVRSQYGFQLDQKDQELVQLRASFSSVQRELAVARDELARKDQEKQFSQHSLEESLRQAAADNVQLNNQVATLRQSEAISAEKAASLAGSQQVLKSMTETYQHAIDQLDHERTTLQSSYEAANQRITALSAEKANVDQQVRDLTGSLDEMRLRTQELIAQHSQELELQQAQVRDLKAKIDSFGQDNEELRRNNQALDLALRDLQLQRKHDQQMLERSLNDAKEDGIRRVQQSAAAEQTLQSQLDSMRNQLSQANTQIQALQSAKDLSAQEVKNLRTQLENFKKERTAQESIYLRQLSDAQNALQQSERNYSQLQQQKADDAHSAQMQIKMLEEQISQAAADITSLRKATFDAKMKSDAEVGDLRLNREQLTRELNDAHVALQRKHTEFVGLQSVLQTANTDRERQREEYERKLQQAHKELQDAGRDNEDLSARLGDLEQTFNELQDEYNLQKLRMHTLHREKEEMLVTKQLQQEAMESSHSDFRVQLGAQHEDLIRLQNDLAATTTQKDAIERVCTTL